MTHSTSSVSETLNKPPLSQRTWAASRGVTQPTSLLILATRQVHTSASCQDGYPGKVSGDQTPHPPAAIALNKGDPTGMGET